MFAMICYPDNIENKIGFTAVRGMIAERCVSEPGRSKCRQMACSSNYEVVVSRLQAVEEMVRALGSDRGFGLSGIYDLAEALGRIRPEGTLMAADDLRRLRSSLLAVEGIRRFFSQGESASSDYPTLSSLASEIVPVEEVLKAIDAVIEPSGEVKDTASDELMRLRRAMVSAQGSISGAMRRVMARAVAQGMIDPDITPSMRDGRLVIPVAPAFKRSIPGIVHDESASGKTFFIEPAEVVEANNRLRELEMEQRREIIRILVALASRLRPMIDDMLADFDILADFDFIRAKALLAQYTGGVMPHVHDAPAMEWYHACHPVLALSLKAQGKEIVPLDIRLTEKERILVISGPNAGGKSVALKTVAIVQYMAQCGVLPPLYDNSHMGIFSEIMIDIGDDQSIEDDLSTYSSHLRNMKYFLSHGSRRSLMLIDEFGSGTEPTLGGAIAQALLARFVEMGGMGVITTHFHNLKEFASQTSGLVNGSMLYDRQRLQPLFSLSIGTPGSSFALEIARKSGLPHEIVEAASEIAGSDYVNLDKYLLDIARDRRYWENKRLAIRRREKEIDEVLSRYQSEAETLHSQSRQIISEAKDQARQIMAQSNAAIERTIHDIRRAQADKEATMEARKKLEDEKKALENDTTSSVHPLLRKADRRGRRKGKSDGSAPSLQTPVRDISVGDTVLLDGSGQPGRVMEISGKNAVVAFGMLKTSVALARLSHTDRKMKSGTSTPTVVGKATSDASRERQLNFRQDIDLRGMRVDEALQAVMYFIDDAVQFNAGRVRILHGTGTGALRTALRDYLRTVPQVESAVDEDVRFGGAGITVVTLR